MKIERLHIDGFGLFNDKSIANFKPGVNILYGKNEAGKSTLLDFIRFTLFGYPTGAGSIAKRRPPLYGGEHGGRIWMKGSEGDDLMVHRKGDLSFSLSHNGIASENLKKYQQLIGNASPDLYQNVYAITIDELMEVKQLTSSGMEDRIFSMGMGLAGVDFGGFERSLIAHAEDYYIPRGRTKIFDGIIQQLEEKAAKISALKARLNDHNRLTESAKELEGSIATLQNDRQHLTIEVANLLNYKRSYEHFVHYQSAQQQLQEVGELKEVPRQLLEDYQGLKQNIQLLESTINSWESELEDAKKQKTQLVINKDFEDKGYLLDYFRSTVKVYEEALLNIAHASTQYAEAEQQQKGIILRLGAGFDVATLIKLEGTIQLRNSANDWIEKSGELARNIDRQEDQQSDLIIQTNQLSGRIESLQKLIASSDISNENKAKEAEQRRVQLDTQLKKILAGTVVQSTGKLTTYAGIGASILLMLAAVILFSWHIALGVTFLVLGVMLLILIISKQKSKSIESPTAGNANTINTELEALKQQLSDFHKNFEQLKLLIQEKSELEERLKIGENRLISFKADRDQLTAHWNEQLMSFGLPDSLTPRMMTDFLAAVDELKRLSVVKEHAHQSKDRFLSIKQEFELKLREVQPDQDVFSSEEIYQLIEALADHEQAVKQLQLLSDDIAKKNTAIQQKKEAYSKQQEFIQDLFAQVGVDDESAFYRFFEKQAIRQEALQLMNQSATTIRSICGQDRLEETIQAIAAFEPSELELVYTQQKEKLETTQHNYEENSKALAAMKTELDHILQMDEMYALLNDKEGLEAQLREAGKEWLATKMALKVLSDAKQKYEEEKQPEVITQTRDIFREITNEAYTDLRISLSERHVSLIDNQGRTKSVDELSRGTREQLLLAFRMGLIAEYEKSAEPLPIVLDDVMVNFDSKRSANLTKTLMHFAEGRQVIMFTCHEHTAALFEESGANVLGW